MCNGQTESSGSAVFQGIASVSLLLCSGDQVPDGWECNLQSGLVVLSALWLTARYDPLCLSEVGTGWDSLPYQRIKDALVQPE
jgi:hypothetical protein